MSSELNTKQREEGCSDRSLHRDNQEGNCKRGRMIEGDSYMRFLQSAVSARVCKKIRYLG